MSISTTDQHRRERLVRRTLAILSVASVASSITNHLEAQPEVAVVFLVGAVAGFSLLGYTVKASPPLAVSGNLTTGIVFFVLAGANLISGGFGLPAHFAMGLVPMIALITVSPRSAVAWGRWRSPRSSCSRCSTPPATRSCTSQRTVTTSGCRRWARW